jgi:DpnD/PcfM-like protein
MENKVVKVVVREVLERVIEVELKDDVTNIYEVTEKVEDMYRECEIVLDADDFVDYEIEILEVVENEK